MKNFTKLKSWLMLMVFGLMLAAPSAFAGEKEISGSVTSTSDYVSCGTGDLGFNLTFVSYDWEWGQELTLTFPAGFTVNSADPINGAAAVITGQEVFWPMNYTNASGQTISVDFNVNVSVGGSVGGDQLVAYLVEGDHWGGAPHTFTGNAVVSQDPNSDPRLMLNPSSVDLGEWPIDGWQEDFFVELFNDGSGTANVTDSELDDPDGVFGLTNPTLPLNLTNCGSSAYVGINFNGSGVADGVYNAVYVASWGSGKSVTTADVTAAAYTAPVGDIAENPFMVALPHADAGVSTALPMRSNYNTPGTATNGKDVVYKFTLAEDKEFNAAITNATEAPKVALYNDGFEGFGGPGVGNAIVSGGSDLTAIPLFAGDYYLVVSCEAADAAMTFDINIDATTMPDPDCAFNEAPADGAIEIPSNGLTLSWDYGQFAQEYQLMFGTTYPPTNELVGWTAVDGAFSGSYDLANLDPSMQYFWQVNLRNNNGTVTCNVWGFTTTLTPPSNLTAAVVEIAEDEYNVVLNWTASAKALLSYN
ncbi:MAG: hypothetical protein GQ527_04920, partial [Bacteroidales bacterium]|nr:hypothetical protein [Bacteroidales bacterium]